MAAALLYGGGYVAFLVSLCLSYWTVHVVLHDSADVDTNLWYSLIPNATSPQPAANLTAEAVVCPTKVCRGRNPLVFRGFANEPTDEYDDTYYNDSVQVFQAEQLYSLGASIGGGKYDVVMIYVTVSHGNKTTSGDDSDDGSELAYAYTSGDSGAQLLATAAATEPWLSLGTLDARINRESRDHPVLLSVNYNDLEECWLGLSGEEQQAFLFPVVFDVLKLAQQTFTGNQPGELKSTNLAWRQLAENAAEYRLGSWLLPYVTPKYSYTFVRCNNFSLFEYTDHTIPAEFKITGSSCLRCFPVRTEPLASSVFSPTYHFVWLWLLLGFLVPAVLSYGIDNAIRFFYGFSGDENQVQNRGQLTTMFKSLDILRGTIPRSGGLRHQVFPSQLRLAAVLLRRPRVHPAGNVAPSETMNESRESKWMVSVLVTCTLGLIVSFFVLGLPTFLQMERSPFYHSADVLPENLSGQSGMGLVAIVLCIFPMFFMVSALVLYINYMHLLPIDTISAQTDLKSIFGIESDSPADLLPVYSEVALVQLLDKALLLYTYRVVLVLTQAIMEIGAWYATLAIVMVGSFIFGLFCFPIIYVISQYFLIFIYTCAGLFHCHFVRSLLAVVLVRILVWRQFFPDQGWHRRVYPLVCSCMQAIVMAADRIQNRELASRQDKQDPDPWAGDLQVQVQNGEQGNRRRSLPEVNHWSHASNLFSSRSIRASATKAFLRVFHATNGDGDGGALEDTEAQQVYENLLHHVQRRTMSWVQRILMSLFVVVAVVVVADEPIAFIFPPGSITAIQKIAILIGVWICTLYSRSTLQKTTHGATNVSEEHLLSFAHRALTEELLEGALPANAGESDRISSGRAAPGGGASTTGGGSDEVASARASEPVMASARPDGVTERSNLVTTAQGYGSFAPASHGAGGRPGRRGQQHAQTGRRLNWNRNIQI